MAIRKTNPNTEFRIGQIVMTEGIMRFGICSWPCEIVAINKSRLTLKRLRRDENFEIPTVKYAKSIKFIADTEDEAFSLHEAHWVHHHNAEQKMTDLMKQIAADEEEILSKFGTKLEELIEQYEQAIRDRNHDEIDRLIMLVEQEADKIGYENHARLASLHTMAERAGESE